MANEKFKKALYDALIPEYVDMLPSCDEVEHEFSPQFEKKMNKLIKRRNKPYYKIINTIGKRVACVAVVIIVVSSITVMSVDALRNAVADFFISIYETFSTVQSTKDNNAPSTIEDIYEITYNLTDFTLEYEDYTEYSRNTTYVRDNIIIDYKQYTKEMYDENINTENAEITFIDINGYEAIYFIDNHNYSNIVWDNGDYIITLFSNVGKDALIDIAKSVQKVE